MFFRSKVAACSSDWLFSKEVLSKSTDFVFCIAIAPLFFEIWCENLLFLTEIWSVSEMNSAEPKIAELL